MTTKHLSNPAQSVSNLTMFHDLTSTMYAFPAVHYQDVDYSDYDTPHIIMTYTALLSLGILRDDFTKLDRAGLLSFLRACQREDGR
jgi:hypothetical protein